MGLIIKKQKGILTFMPDYKFFAQGEALEISKKISDFIQRPNNDCKVIVDCQKIEMMNSSGLGVLITILHQIKDINGQLRLVNLAPNIEGVLKITKLDLLFKICKNLEEAEASFN